MTTAPTVNTALFKKDFLVVLVIVANAFSWFFPLYLFFKDTLESQVDTTTLLVMLSIHFVGIIGFAFAGTELVQKIDRRLLLLVWMFVGTLASAMMFMLNRSDTFSLFIVSFTLGISLGLGFPSCLAYFGDYTIEKSRGFHGGIVFFASGICILLVGLMNSMFALVVNVIIFTIWRTVGLLLLLLIKPKQHLKQKTNNVSFKSILFDKSLVLYLVPWVMFCLVNFLESPIVTNFVGTEFATLTPIAEYGIGAFSALISGWFSDSVGRKRIVIIGFIMLGVGYAILGLFSNFMFSWYLYIILDGVAWGIFSLMFYLVIWGDLARDRIKEKYYLIGVLPFLISSYVQILFTPYAESVPISVAFSLASFFLFLAVLPLLYAPETLSEKEIEKKRLSKYLDDAKMVKQKYEQ